MKSIRNLIVALVLAACGSAVTAQTTIDSIVAVINEDVILRSELDRALGRVLAQIAQSNQALPPRDVLERQVLDQLVMIELQVQRAQETGVRISDDEVDGSIARLAQQSGITPEQMRQTIIADGMNWSVFRDSLREEIMISRLHQRVANSRVNVSESEIDIFLANREAVSGEYRLHHILIGIPEGASPQQVQATRDKAAQVHAEIQGGMDFATAAITYSDGQQALQGGDLGWRSYDQMPEVFGDLVSGLQPDEVARPVRSASGYHIIKYSDHREISRQMIEEYRAQHIMIEVTELVGPTEALDLVNDIHQRILEGADFSDLARQYSDDASSANLGGDMGWFQPLAFGERVRQVLESLDNGEISQPFQTAAGWHILQKNDERTIDRTEELVRAQARDALRQRKAGEEIELYLREMRDEAFIELRV